MTRFASIMGVAAVATLVLLSGCETPMKTDYAKKLEGTWTVTTKATVPNPDPATQPTMPTIQIDAQVTVAIVDGEGVNKGTFSLVVTTPGPVDPTTMMPTSAQTTGSGSINDASSSKLMVTLTQIVGPTVPPEATALLNQEQTIGYALDGNSLTITHALLAVLGVAKPDMPSLTLTKGMASN